MLVTQQSAQGDDIMARPPEGLGAAFSCRLQEEDDKAAREERAKTGQPLSHVVRRWLSERRDLLEKNDPKWCEKYHQLRDEHARLKERIKRAKKDIARCSSREKQPQTQSAEAAA